MFHVVCILQLLLRQSLLGAKFSNVHTFLLAVSPWLCFQSDFQCLILNWQLRQHFVPDSCRQPHLFVVCLDPGRCGPREYCDYSLSALQQSKDIFTRIQTCQKLYPPHKNGQAESNETGKPWHRLEEIAFSLVRRSQFDIKCKFWKQMGMKNWPANFVTK